MWVPGQGQSLRLNDVAVDVDEPGDAMGLGGMDDAAASDGDAAAMDDAAASASGEAAMPASPSPAPQFPQAVDYSAEPTDEDRPNQHNDKPRKTPDQLTSCGLLVTAATWKGMALGKGGSDSGPAEEYAPSGAESGLRSTPLHAMHRPAAPVEKTAPVWGA
eukprot:g11788.t1